MFDLQNPQLLNTKAYVNGGWVDGDGTFDVTNPQPGDVIATVADGDAAMTDTAIAHAAAAQKDWAAQTALVRADTLMRFYTLMMENQRDLAVILTAEMGKPLAEAVGEVGYGASFIRWFAEEARRSYGDTIPGHQPDKRLFALKQPIGVVGAITPWNFPNAMITRKLAPALAAGCAMVLKPASETPLSALAMAYLAEQAGLPKGLFNVIPSSRSAAVGKALCDSNTVTKLTFYRLNRCWPYLDGAMCANDKKLGLELGGNAPFIVFDDADLDKAVEGAMIAKYRNNGQTCVCANRIYVQASVYDAFAEKLKTAVEQLKIGDGFDDGVILGPLIDEKAVTKVETHISDAVAHGATLMTGGARHEKGGTFFQPTILRDVTSDMKVATEETFGPVSPLFRFETEDEVIAAANNTIFGLAAYFYARDVSRVWRVGEALEYGMVGVNTGLISTAEAPFGGVKQSGLGREGSHYGLEDFQEIKYLCLSV